MADILAAALGSTPGSKALSLDSKAPSPDGMLVSPAVDMGLDKDEGNKQVPVRRGPRGWKRTIKEVLDPAKKKRRRPKHNLCCLTELKPTECAYLPCVFVPNAEKHSKEEIHAVALWPQYSARWRGQTFEGYRWLKLGPYEPWLEQVLHHLTSINKKRVASLLCEKVRAELKSALHKARNITDDDAQLDSDCEDTAGLVGRCGAVTAVVGAHSVFILNNQKIIALAVDEDTTTFINSWLVPLAKEAIRLCAAKFPAVKRSRNGKKTAELPLVQQSSCVITFSSNPCPDIKGKVTWVTNPGQWKIEVDQPRSSNNIPIQWNLKLHPAKSRGICTFAVDQSLTGAAYDSAKLKQYYKAIQAWNKIDGGNRNRITEDWVKLSENGTLGLPAHGHGSAQPQGYQPQGLPAHGRASAQPQSHSSACSAHSMESLTSTSDSQESSLSSLC